jgi:DNA-binding CsgD family transcriptional regulator
MLLASPTSCRGTLRHIRDNPSEVVPAVWAVAAWYGTLGEVGAGPVEAFVGRAEELEMLRGRLDFLRQDNASTTLVWGDAGVGKTSLVSQASRNVAGGAEILQAACLPMTSVAVPYQVLRSLIRGVEDPNAASSASMFEDEGSGSSVPVLFDRWLDDLCGKNPVIVIIDDLQWADPSTLDVLMYLIAGVASRPLAIVATVRSSEIVDGHDLHGWLADVRRLPRFEEITLGPLDRVTTGEQIAGLLGGSSHETLVDEVFGNTRGNAYLNRLLVNGLRPDAQHLPAGIPTTLTDAVLRSWHRLSPAARRLTSILATGGRPLAVEEIAAVAADPAAAGETTALLAEAESLGVLDVGPDGRYWFHHPLQAEELERHLPQAELSHWHNAFADDAERRLSQGPGDELELLVAAADHHFRAGDTARAYHAALRAADATDASAAITETLRMLRRAADLREGTQDAEESHLDLLKRLRSAAAAAGDAEVELGAVEALLTRTSPDHEPLDRSELIVRRMHLHFMTGRGFIAAEPMREAVRLSEVDPASWQHALALAELAHACLWQDDPAGEELANRAVTIAEMSGSLRSLAYALTARSMALLGSDRVADAEAAGSQAYRAAVGSGDAFACVHAVLWEANAIDIWSSPVGVNHLAKRRAELTDMGIPHPYIAWLSSAEAGGLLALGQWAECQSRLRVALGAEPGAVGGVAARLTAARLAALQGRVGEAQAHLARADELFAETATFLAFEFEAVRTEVLLAAGEPEAAYDTAMKGADTAVPATMSEWLAPLAARALAETAEHLRDAGQDTAHVMAQLDELVQRFPQPIQDGPASEFYATQLLALDALYAAEVGRARRDVNNSGAWVRAADALHAVPLPWEECYASWRAAQAQLVIAHGPRGDAAELLRRGWDLADRLQAIPVKTSIEHLASAARLPLGPLTAHSDDAAPALLPGMTPREMEIVQHIVLGRTYAEIARALFISEKTVSSHISNILRKTGAANRIDLARIATRPTPRSSTVSRS